MSELVRIAEVRPLEGHWVRLWFTNGVVKDVDLGEALAGGGVFDEIYRRRDSFEQVRVNPETRTIEWPGGVDLDPDVLYGLSKPRTAFGSSAGSWASLRSTNADAGAPRVAVTPGLAVSRAPAGAAADDQQTPASSRQAVARSPVPSTIEAGAEGSLGRCGGEATVRPRSC